MSSSVPTSPPDPALISFTRRSLVLLGSVVLLTMATDVLLITGGLWLNRSPYRLTGQCLLTFTNGVVIGQLALAAVFTALGTSKNHFRILCMTIVLILWISAVWKGTGAFVQVLNPGEQSLLVIAAVFAFYLIQIPFWFLRSVRGWRILHGSDSARTPRRQFSMVDILGWSLFMTLPLVFCEVLLFAFRPLQLIGVMSTLIVFIFVAGVTYAYVAFVVAPWYRQTMFAVCAISALAIISALGLWYVWHVEPWEAVMSAVALHLGVAVAILAPLSLARRSGYVLSWS